MNAAFVEIMKKKHRRKTSSASLPKREERCSIFSTMSLIGHVQHWLSLPWVVPVMGGGCLLLVCALYSPAWFAPFYYDDIPAILLNDSIKSVQGLIPVLKGFYYSRGFVQLTLWMDWNLYGDHASGYHLTSILLHLLCTVMVWITVRNLFRFFFPQEESVSRLTGFVSALIFGIHPINTEAVSYVISRADIISTLAYLVTFIICLKIFMSIREQNPFIQRILKLLAISFLLGLGTLLGLGGKEIVVTLPAMFVITIAVRQRLRIPAFYREVGIILLPLGLLFAFYAISRIQTFGSFLGFEDAYSRPWGLNLITQFSAWFCYYLPQAFLPLHLNFLPEYPLVVSWTDSRLLIAFLLATGTILLCFYTFRRQPLITWSILWFVVTISVTSSFIPLMEIVTERRLYLPLAGLVVLVELLLRQRWFQRKVWVLALVVYVSFLGYKTYERNMDYAIPERFWRKTALASPHNMNAFLELLKVYRREGNLQKALALFQINNEINLVGRNLTSPRQLNELIDFLFPRGLWREQGIQLAEQGVRENPKSIEHWETLQMAYLLTGQYNKLDEAIEQTLKLNRGTRYH
jgi:hypothetical protein